LVVTTGRQPVTQTVTDILAKLPAELQTNSVNAAGEAGNRDVIAAEEAPDERA
jgi:DNA-binding protein